MGGGVVLLLRVYTIDTSLAIGSNRAIYATGVGSRVDLAGEECYGYTIYGVLGVTYGYVGVLTIEGILRYDAT